MNRPPSLALIGAILLAYTTLFFSTGSVLLAIVPLLYGASLIFPTRLSRDATVVWGLRLLVIGSMALLGRMEPEGRWFDYRTYVTLGLIAGGELIIQAFREPPRELRFDPTQIVLTGIVFLVGCNTFRPHLFWFAPPFVACLLLALGDLRPRAGRRSWTQILVRWGAVAFAAFAGAMVHGALDQRRGEIMSFGGQFLSAARIQSSGAEVAEQPQLGSSFNANASTARLLRIEGSLKDPHLRTGAFHEYQNGTWGPQLSTREIEAALPKETNEEDPNSPTLDLRTDYNARITVLRATNKVVFAPLNVAALVPKDGSSFDWHRFSGPLQIEDDPPVSYGIVEGKDELFDVPTTQGPLCVVPNAEQRARLLDIPAEIDPRVVDLAQEVTLEATNEGEKAAMVVEYLLENNKYSLDFQRGTMDPVSDFLLNKKAAHCQYFAAGAVMMLRAVGIPARYASGYYAHETASDGTTIVRGRDAHAWTEAYINGVGWINLDATPPAGRADPRANPLPWYQRALEWAQDSFTNVRAWFSQLTTLQIAGIMFGMLALWGLERARQAWKRRRSAPPSTTPPALQPMARRFERTLKKRGITLLPGQPWSESLPDEWNAEREWIERYNQLRFAARDEEQLAQLNEQLRAIEKTKS